MRGLIFTTLALGAAMSVHSGEGDLLKCMEEHCVPQAAACGKAPKCSAGITCVENCPEPVTEECTVNCLNTHMDLAMISLGACASSNGCLSESAAQLTASKARIASRAAVEAGKA